MSVPSNAMDDLCLCVSDYTGDHDAGDAGDAGYAGYAAAHDAARVKKWLKNLMYQMACDARRARY